VTHEDIVYDRRVRLIEHAARINNVAEAEVVPGLVELEVAVPRSMPSLR
jgi:hypothetical protein